MANLTAIETGENLLGYLGYRTKSRTSIRTGVTRTYYAAQEEHLQNLSGHLLGREIDVTFERKAFHISPDTNRLLYIDPKVTDFHGVLKEITPRGIKLLHMDHMQGRVHFMPWHNLRSRNHQVIMSKRLTRLALASTP